MGVDADILIVSSKKIIRATAIQPRYGSGSEDEYVSSACYALIRRLEQRGVFMRDKTQLIRDGRMDNMLQFVELW